MAFNGTHAVTAHDPSHYPHTAPCDLTDDAGGANGEYECLVCGYQTDIENEHEQYTKHWCQGACDEITTFRRDDE